MGANLCSFRRLPKDDVLHDQPNFSLMKPSRSKVVKKKRQLHSQEKKLTRVRNLTLEEWLIASPGLKQDSINEGELHVFRQSSRVYPSTPPPISTRVNALFSFNSRVSLSKERMLKSDEVEKEEMMVISSPSRSQREKTKKKVSFRMPDEADIIIFYPFEDEFGK